ncbi:hypothetical protein HDU86_002086 [Geranomyces michiganensis]|nr:hypothetical protein HDU86_002086 [Geranomyces michiganensis]
MDPADGRCYESASVSTAGAKLGVAMDDEQCINGGQGHDIDVEEEEQIPYAASKPVPQTPRQSLTNIAVDESKLEIDRQIIISNQKIVTEAPGYAWFQQDSAAAPAASKAYILELLIEFCGDFKSNVLW